VEEKSKNLGLTVSIPKSSIQPAAEASLRCPTSIRHHEVKRAHRNPEQDAVRANHVSAFARSFSSRRHDIICARLLLVD